MEKQTHQQGEHQQLVDLINNTKINKKYLADLADINPYTFKMKLSNKPRYKFTDAEIEKIKTCLCELGGLLKNHCSKKK